MSELSPPSAGPEPASRARRIDRVCTQFEVAWRDGGRPRIEDFLGDAAGPERTELLHELLLLEWDYLRARGEDCPAGDYRARFPDLDPAWLAETGAARPPEAPAFTPEGPGTVLGPYTLLEQLGEGGFGRVFRAEQQQPVRRQVALKVIKPGMDTRQVIARFEAERQALALMDHPNIARVLDAGTTPSGRPHFVMELVPGVPITDYCDQNRLPPRERLALFVSVCRAVQHAHQKGIIHRDLKPSNVLVTAPDGAAVAKVIDFGIAKALGQRLTDRTLVTGAGQLLGTPLYMSPEQADLGGLDVDTRTDVYALGVLLYELLTGQTPFDRRRLQEAGYDEMRRIIREEEPARPSARLSTLGPEATVVSARRQSDPGRLRVLLRGELDWIAMKALDKDRRRRYETAGAFADDVQRYLRDEPVAACPPSAWYRCRKFGRRHRAALRTAAAAAAVLLLAAGGGGWALWDQAARRAELSRRRAETERAVSGALAQAEQWCDQAGKMPGTTSPEAEAVLVVWQQADAALAPAEAALNTGTADDRLRQRVLDVRQQIEPRRAQARRKAQLLRDLDDARMALSAWVGTHFDDAGASAKYAAAFAAYGLEVKPGRTEELARRIRAEEPASRDALIVALDAWSANAVVAKTEPLAKELRALADAADDDAWRRTYRAAIVARDTAAVRSLSGEARRLSLPPATLWLLALDLDTLGDHDEALALLRWARGRHPTDFWLPVALGEHLYGSKDPSPVDLEEAIGCFRVAVALRPAAAAAHNNLGLTLHARNQMDEAMAEYRRAIALDPKLARAHYNLGLALAAGSRRDEAIAEYRRAVALDPRLAQAYYDLGNALAAGGQRDEAIAAYRKAIAIAPGYAPAHNNLGNALAANNQLNGAIAAFREAIDLDPKFARAHYNLGNVLRRNKDLDAAIAAYRTAIGLNPRHAPSHCNLGMVFLQQGRFAEARTCTEQALRWFPPNDPERPIAVRQLEMCDRLLALEARLADALAGKAPPGSSEERLDLIAVCQLQRRYAAASQLLRDALAADANLADDLKAGQRRRAARFAALASAGQGTDADRLDDRDRTRLRRQALAWLRADLDLWGQRLGGGSAADRLAARDALRDWQRDPDLTGVRDAGALRKLPAAEQEACRNLWADVAEVLRKAGDVK